MKLKREFVRQQMLSIKEEKDKETNEIDNEINLINSNIKYYIQNLEEVLKSAFPMLRGYCALDNIPPPTYARSLDPLKILNGEDPASISFKRHLEFLKLSNSKLVKDIDETVNYYFDYRKKSFDGACSIKKAVELIRRMFPNVNLNLTGNSKSASKAPVTISIPNNKLNEVNVILDNGLETTIKIDSVADYDIINNTVKRVINREFMEKLGFDYYKFHEVNDAFIKCISELCEHVFLKSNERIKERVSKEPYDYDGVNYNIRNGGEWGIEADKYVGVRRFVIYIKKPDGTDMSIELCLDSSLTEIKCKFRYTTHIQDILIFSVNSQENKLDFLHFYDGKEEKLIPSELYKLMILKHTPELINKKDTIINQINTKLTEI